MNRRDELERNLRELRARIADACAAAGRSPDETTLVAVTKTWPAADVRLLAELGVADVGENRDQEAAPKARQCGDLDLTWHFVGQLQTNKCRSVATYADVVHSVDRQRLAAALGRAAREAGRTIDCLVQVDLTEPTEGKGDPGRGGVPPADAQRLADVIAVTEGLALKGVMGMAPLRGDPRPSFALLADVAARLRQAHPGATAMSAGMSADLEPALSCGATHLRVGTALLGARSVDVR